MRSSQIKVMDRMQMGMEMKNQIPQPGAGCMFCSAMRFRGEAIGDAAPPILEAKATPRTRAFDILESSGKLRRMGCKTKLAMEYHLLLGCPHTWSIE